MESHYWHFGGEIIPRKESKNTARTINKPSEIPKEILSAQGQQVTRETDEATVGSFLTMDSVWGNEDEQYLALAWLPQKSEDRDLKEKESLALQHDERDPGEQPDLILESRSSDVDPVFEARGFWDENDEDIEQAMMARDAIKANLASAEQELAERLRLSLDDDENTEVVTFFSSGESEEETDIEGGVCRSTSSDDLDDIKKSRFDEDEKNSCLSIAYRDEIELSSSLMKEEERREGEALSEESQIPLCFCSQILFPSQDLEQDQCVSLETPANPEANSLPALPEQSTAPEPLDDAAFSQTELEQAKEPHETEASTKVDLPEEATEFSDNVDTDLEQAKATDSKEILAEPTEDADGAMELEQAKKADLAEEGAVVDPYKDADAGLDHGVDWCGSGLFACNSPFSFLLPRIPAVKGFRLAAEEVSPAAFTLEVEGIDVTKASESSEDEEEDDTGVVLVLTDAYVSTCVSVEVGDVGDRATMDPSDPTKSLLEAAESDDDCSFLPAATGVNEVDFNGSEPVEEALDETPEQTEDGEQSQVDATETALEVSEDELSEIAGELLSNAGSEPVEEALDETPEQTEDGEQSQVDATETALEVSEDELSEIAGELLSNAGSEPVEEALDETPEQTEDGEQSQVDATETALEVSEDELSEIAGELLSNAFQNVSRSSLFDEIEDNDTPSDEESLFPGLLPSPPSGEEEEGEEEEAQASQLPETLPVPSSREVKEEASVDGSFVETEDDGHNGGDEKEEDTEEEVEVEENQLLLSLAEAFLNLCGDPESDKGAVAVAMACAEAEIPACGPEFDFAEYDLLFEENDKDTKEESEENELLLSLAEQYLIVCGDDDEYEDCRSDASFQTAKEEEEEYLSARRSRRASRRRKRRSGASSSARSRLGRPVELRRSRLAHPVDRTLRRLV